MCVCGEVRDIPNERKKITMGREGVPQFLTNEKNTIHGKKSRAGIFGNRRFLNAKKRKLVFLSPIVLLIFM